ncbi:hypothetical protein PSECIP111854_02939 [Pseudoalteromonas sp. CIP111854]|uniref:Uncharacterized protein n=1 Tax=Pseudoalteromonas holothuriae TaxID=2963714 RepID=A0A9W4R161_9GAMM|nr:hypothetical protein [Pseudoalteromonas sp. CIP111854]CAH9062071.1 hypothetical protein PSECIP111854_02939 [Pseudoalteromonas sp. CIP111854]
MSKHIIISLIAFMCAVIDAIGGMLGYWSVSNSQSRYYIFGFELLTLCLLVVNSFLIAHYLRTSKTQFRLAVLCFIALVFCVLGDIVNFNLGGEYYGKGDVIKHDYLIDSIWFFGPGYLLIVVALMQILLQFYQPKVLLVCVIGSLLLATLSYTNMVILGSGVYIISMAFFYSLVISLPALCGVLLLLAYGFNKAPICIWVISLGLVLASIADAIIGQFWLFGNNGKGIFPLAREINWIVYIASQSIIVHIPRILPVDERSASINHQKLCKG